MTSSNLPLPVTDEVYQLRNIIDSRAQRSNIEALPTRQRDEYKQKFHNFSGSMEDASRLIQGLSANEAAHILVTACLQGDLEIAKAVRAHHPDVTITYERSKYHDLINSTPLVRSSLGYLSNTSSQKEIGELLEWMPTAGLGFMVGQGGDHTLMLNAESLYPTVATIQKEKPFEGELPMLNHGVVHNPELLDALLEKQSISHYENSFKEILCWVSESMFQDFNQDLPSFHAVQQMNLYRENSSNGRWEVFGVDFDELTDDLLAQVSNQHREKFDLPLMYVGLELRTQASQEAGQIMDPKDNMLLGHLANQALQLGFDHKPGYVLCRTSTDFLKQFDMGPLSENNLQKAAEFTDRYFPLDLVLLDYAHDASSCALIYKLNTGLHLEKIPPTVKINQLFELMGQDSLVRDKMIRLMRPEHWDFIVDMYIRTRHSEAALLAMYHALGRDNTGMHIEGLSKTLEKLMAGGYRFADETRAVKVENKGRWGAATFSVAFENEFTLARLSGKSHEGVAQAMSMNLWPSYESTKPSSLDDAIKAAARKRKWDETSLADCALQEYLKNEGIEACVERVKTPAQWRMLGSVFGGAQLHPYLDRTPREIRGEILSDSLGI